jgi:hypothetical protein
MKGGNGLKDNGWEHVLGKMIKWMRMDERMALDFGWFYGLG